VTFCIVGVTVLQLYANDPDRGVNGSITFSLVEQSSLFRVSADGRITTRGQGSSFDRETQDTHSLMVRASDGGSPPKTGILQVLLMLCLLLFYYLCHQWIEFCLTGPISLCIDSFVFMCKLYLVCFCFTLHSCCIVVSAVGWTGWD